jgi:hypothetical protein
MALTTSMQVFLVGTAGGVLLELLHWYALRRDGRLPDYAYSAFYWGISAVMALAGGVLAWLYFGSRAEGIVALHVGLSAPLIFQKLSTTLAQTQGAKGLKPDWQSFLRW